MHLQKYAEKKFKDGVALYTCHCNKQLVDRVDADIEEAVESAQFIDINLLVPVQFAKTDVIKLIEMCPAAVGKGNKIQVMEGIDGLLVSTAMMVTSRTRFEEAAADVVNQAAAAGKLSSATSSSSEGKSAAQTTGQAGGGSKKGKAVATPANDDDDDGARLHNMDYSPSRWP